MYSVLKFGATENEPVYRNQPSGAPGFVAVFTRPECLIEAYAISVENLTLVK